MEKKVEVEVQGKYYSNWYLSEREVNAIGKEKKCLCCGNPFVVGEAEVGKKLVDENGRAFSKVDVCRSMDSDDADFGDFVDAMYYMMLEDIRQGVVVLSKAELKALKANRELALDSEPENWLWWCDMKVKDIPSDVPLKDKAVMCLVDSVNQKVCSRCFAINREEGDVNELIVGRGSGSVSGEIESN